MYQIKMLLLAFINYYQQVYYVLILQHKNNVHIQ